MSDTNIIPVSQKPPIVVLREKLVARRNELKDALTDIDPDHFIRALITAAQINPELQACSFSSLWLAVMAACRDNLLPNSREGVIVPFRDRATWIPMYAGLIKRFRQSGECRWITAEVVRKGEKFQRWIDQNGEHFHHVPEGDDAAPIEKVYAAATTKDGAFYVAVLSITEINKIKAISKSTRDDAPWKMWPAEMMKKTALRRLSKLLPAGRNLFEEDDLPSLPQPSIAIDNERAPGAASALEQFAGVTAPATGEGDPAGAEIGPTPAEPDALLTDHFVIAYERGQIAKATGALRRAVPGEYRDEANARELEAWLAGYDDKPWINPETGETLGNGQT